MTRIAPLALALALIWTAPAFAAQHVYYVHGSGDPALATCQPYTGVPAGFYRCDSLRAAVVAANGNVNAAEEMDFIYLQPAGDIAVGAQLTLTDRVGIFGRGPRTTTVRSAGAGRVFEVTDGVEAILSRFTIAGGNAGASRGGNILNQGDLTLVSMRVTGGQALRGGGIANVGAGRLGVLTSLIDNNDAVLDGFGGGIYSEGSGGLSIVSSTVAFNSAAGEIGTGAGVATFSVASAVGATIARNEALSGAGAGGIFAPQGVTVTLGGSIVAANTQLTGGVANCGGGGAFSDLGQTNVEDGTTCLFEFTGNPGLSGGLVNAGGDTDVLTIAADGVADSVSDPCFATVDQRGAPRPEGGFCDAGAYELGATPPPINSDPFEEPSGPPPENPPPENPPQENPPPASPPPAPPATPPPPTVSQQPAPVANQTVVAAPVRGTIRVRVRGSNRFVTLQAGQAIRVGSTIDARKGTVEITAIPRPGRPVETAEFRAGIFRITQSRGITDLRLTEKLSCSRRASAAQRKKVKKRRLWGKGSGRFRTTGSYAAATVRGTEWLVQDTCTSTLVRVREGSVTVRDKVARRTVIVRAGRSYTARKRR